MLDDSTDGLVVIVLAGVLLGQDTVVYAVEDCRLMWLMAREGGLCCCLAPAALTSSFSRTSLGCLD